MVRRRLKSDFVGGAYVFPGGTLDATDSSGGLLNRLHDVSAEEWGLRLNLPGSQAGAHLVAAIRETFEEAGVLLATPRNSGNATSQNTTRFWQTQRQALLTGQMTWPDLADLNDLLFPTGRVAYFAHWITPVGVPKRFSTRFFVAAAPEGQIPMADDCEVEAGVWIKPEDALRAKREGRMTIVLPTQRALEAIAPFASPEAVIDAYRHKVIETILPRIVLREGRVVSLLPGEPGYIEAEGEPVPPFDPSVL